MKATFLAQLKALLWRNLLLKSRNRSQLVQELFYPLMYIGILVMIKVLTKPATKPTISFPVNDLSGFSIPANTSLYVFSNVPNVDTVMNRVVAEFDGVDYKLFATENEVLAAYEANKSRVAAGIYFYSMQNYTIRMPRENIVKTDTMYAKNQGQCRRDPSGRSSLLCDANLYLTSGFAYLQQVINQALVEEVATGVSTVNVSVQIMQKGEYTPDVTYIQTISSIYFVLAYSFFLNFLTVNLVAEKEKKIREGMFMMGLRNSVFWLSWSIIYFLIILVVTSVVTLIAGLGTFFQSHSNLFLLWLMLMLYGLSIIAMGFLFSPFFKNPRTAGFVAGFATLLISLIYLAVSQTRTITPTGYNYGMPPGAQWVICIFSPVALALAMDKGLYLDIAKGGMTFGNMDEGFFPLYAPFIMLTVDVVLYFVLAIYLDHVIPGEYGIRYKPWYFIQKSYWFPRKSTAEERAHLVSNQEESDGPDAVSGPNIEPVSSDMRSKRSLRIINITKTFSGSEGPVTAVKNLSLDMYEGQITALLGHNGAGKTTLINMLTGIMPTTSGTATICGLDISCNGDMGEIRQMCGICPQHNILYDELSTKEHLHIFAGIKGVPSDKVEQEVSRALESVDLSDQAEVLASKLSGGQKRKLSVAMALIGDPKIIVLDEPTAGMDPYSRRHLWSLLKNNKKGRLILLTTHFMDEADILADRKAIVSKGQLKCCGSSLFLKSKFGIGYHLNMVVEPFCNTETVTTMLQQHVEGVKFDRSYGKELSFTIPLTKVHNFPELFTALETKEGSRTVSESMGIITYGVSMPTLEEVFLKLATVEESEEKESPTAGFENGSCNRSLSHLDLKIAGQEQDDQVHIHMRTNADELPQELPACEKGKTTKIFLALMKLRFLLFIRVPAAVVFLVILPVGLVVGALLLNKQSSGSNLVPKALKLSGHLYAENASSTGQKLPDFLLQDSVNNAVSGSLLSHLESMYAVKKHSGPLNVSDVAPVFLGSNLLATNATNLERYTALYNDTALHSLPAIISTMTSTILRQAGQALDIITYSLPWPSDKTEDFNSGAFTSSLMIGIAFSFVVPMFATGVVQEKQWKCKSQLRIAGLSFNMYWGTIFLSSLAACFVPCLICIIIVLAMKIPSLEPAGASVMVVLLFLLYLPQALMLALVFTFFFNKYETAQAVLMNVFSMGGMMPYFAVALLDMLAGEGVATALHYIFVFIDPIYTIFGGFYYIDKIYRQSLFTNIEPPFGDYFKFENNVIICPIACIVDFLLLYLLLRILDVKSNGGDWKEAVKCSHENSVSDIPKTNSDAIEHEDDDVAFERNKVDQLEKSADVDRDIVAHVSQIRKEFIKTGKAKQPCTKPPMEKVKVAVRNLSFAVNTGEVLGLLGPNGAGKTTALSMMTAEVHPSKGKVVVAGHHVRSNMSAAFQALGFCPQHDPLWENIKLEEHLRLYAAIKGIPDGDVSNVIEYYMENLKIEEHRNKLAKKISGGTKRKLCYAISMLGNPHVVLLDEPSTGMDPQSKRFLWDTISHSFVGQNRGAILTTHYMEEADALCTRVGIMVNGQLECLGPTQHLKMKFGSGYLLEVKLGGSTSGATDEELEERVKAFEQHLMTLFPNAVCLENFAERAQYKIPQSDVGALSKTFAALEKAKQTHGLEEYSFSQSTLEQVFLNFAKKQLEEGEDVNNVAIKKTMERQLSKSVAHPVEQFDEFNERL